MISNRETTSKERASYYIYFLGQNMLYFIVSQYAMLYFTDYVGISAAVIGTIFLIARIWDAANDPIFGVVVDRCNLKGGKYKPWINIASIILPIISLLIFCVPDISVGGKTAYIAVVYILWGMSYTVSDVPGFGISTVITNNINERNSLLANSRLFAIAGLLIVSMGIIPLSDKFGWSGAALIIAIVGMLLMNLMRFNVKEKYSAKNDSISIKKIIKYVIHNKYLLIYYSGITLWLAFSTSMMAMNYFAIYNLGDSKYIAIMMMLSTIPMLLAAVMAPSLIQKFGKNKITIASCLIAIITQVTFFIVGYDSVALVCIFLVIIGISTGLINVMYPMFTADCIEYGTWKTGERASGISFSIQTFTTKLGQAVAAALAGFILTAINYVPNVEQSASTLKGIFSMITIIPAIGIIGMLVIFALFYKLKDSDIEMYIKENSKLEDEL